MADLIVADASVVVEVVTGTAIGTFASERMMEAAVLAAPHIVDVEVLGVLRLKEMKGSLDRTAARQAAEDLAVWPADRYGHRSFVGRMWELRSTVRTWDAAYVALAEALGAVLLTTDGRLARASGPKCAIEVAT